MSTGAEPQASRGSQPAQSGTDAQQLAEPAGVTEPPLAFDALKIELAASMDSMDAVDALMEAVDRGDIAAARSLAAHDAVRAGLQGPAWSRLEILACLALSGCPELERQAVDAVRAEPGLTALTFTRGQSLLHAAARGWRADLAEMLLDLDSDPNLCDSAGHPPLYYSGNTFPRPRGVSDADAYAFVRLMKLRGADLDLAEGVKRCTPLHMAARRGHAVLADALVRCGAQIEARDSNGETPLRRAVNCNHPGVAERLLALGANPNSRCNRGRTPRNAARTDTMRSLFGV